MSKSWLITGVSSGLGRALAEAALARGDQVAGTLRNEAQLAEFEALAPGRAHAISLDVTDDEAVGPAVRAARDAMGGLDVVVNNAGYALIGAAEELSLDEIRRQMETNVVGVIKVCQAVLPLMREAGGGRIINIASVAAARGIPAYSLYCASKYAVSGFSAALALEVGGFGVKVTAVEPGGFRTKFGSTSLTASKRSIEAYAPLVSMIKERMKSFDTLAANDPEKGAEALLALADMDDPPVYAALGADGLQMVRDAVAARLAEYDRSEGVLTDTAFDPEDAGA